MVVQYEYKLLVVFNDGITVIYDVGEDIDTMKDFAPLKDQYCLFNHPQLDESRTFVFWNDRIDLASDTIREYGKLVISKE